MSPCNRYIIYSSELISYGFCVCRLSPNTYFGYKTNCEIRIVLCGRLRQIKSSVLAIFSRLDDRVKKEAVHLKNAPDWFLIEFQTKSLVSFLTIPTDFWVKSDKIFNKPKSGNLSTLLLLEINWTSLNIQLKVEETKLVRDTLTI